jgi:hypothetical protein
VAHFRESALDTRKIAGLLEKAAIDQGVDQVLQGRLARSGLARLPAVLGGVLPFEVFHDSRDFGRSALDVDLDTLGCSYCGFSHIQVFFYALATAYLNTTIEVKNGSAVGGEVLNER